MANFWLTESIKFVVLLALAYGLGLLVHKVGVKVNYTRKVIHFTLFFLPVFLASKIPFDASLTTTLLSGALFLLTIALMIKPIRDRHPFINTAFASIDRPEDRPYTLIWASTQVLATYLVIVLMLWWLGQYERTSLIYITVLIAAIGDGLAEPVGIRFGRHKYTTRALFCNRTYTRSLEGSACVFLSGLLACYLLKGALTDLEFLIAILLIPAAMTLAEAFSPHTWDGPFLYLIGGTTTVATIQLAATINTPG